jgi:hypothetical protein
MIRWFEVVKGQDFMGKRLALLAIRLFVSVNLLYAAIFLKFAGVPDSVTLSTQMSQTVHGFVSQPVFRLGSGVFETVLAVLLLIWKTARLGAGLAVVWMTAVFLSHIFVLGYGWFLVDALKVMVLAVIYLMLTPGHSDWGEPESVRTTALERTKNSRENRWKRSHKMRVIVPSTQVHIVVGGHFSLTTAATEIVARAIDRL